MTKLKNIQYRVAPFTTVHIEFIFICGQNKPMLRFTRLPYIGSCVEMDHCADLHDGLNLWPQSSPNSFGNSKI